MSSFGRTLALCLLGTAACGPYSDDEPGATASTPAGSSIDGGSSPDSGSATPSSEPASAEVQQLLVVHDLHADSLTAAVVYTHDLKAKEAHYDELVIISESDLPSPGDQDLHDGGSVTTDEVHAHRVDVKLLHAGTVYVVKKPK